uniref:Cadherin domain-containing protein n=1 Tax=Cyprinodon variegatus TaxID=28743 RepID=A0A3Q2FYU6_CYPVA
MSHLPLRLNNKSAYFKKTFSLLLCIIVEVTDINDNDPKFDPVLVTKSVPENAEVESNVAEIKATDIDSGFNKEIRYSLRGGEGRFSVDPVSGLVSLGAQLDRETTAEYELLVVAEDQGRPARSATATLQVQVTDVNDNPPKFSEPEYQLEVLETESVGATLLSLSPLSLQTNMFPSRDICNGTTGC